MPPLGRNHSMTDTERRIRKTSFKNVLKQGGEKFQNVMNGVTNRNSASFDLPRPPISSNNSYDTKPDRITPPTPSVGLSPSKSIREWKYDQEDSTQDTVIEKRVLEMAGLGLGDSPRSTSLARRVQSEGVRHLDPGHGGTEMSRSRSADDRPEMTIGVLRELADNPVNSKCADCKKPTKASQWASLSAYSFIDEEYTDGRSTWSAHGDLPVYTMLWTPSRTWDPYLQTTRDQSRPLVSGEYSSSL